MANDDELSLGKADRLPWLEPAEEAAPAEPASPAKAVGLILAVVLALAILAGGLWWLRGREAVPKGDGSLITAPVIPYKVRPSETGGMKVEGQGDAAFAASEGAEASGQLDLAAQPESPVAGKPATASKPSSTGVIGPHASAPVAVGGKLVAPRPNVPAPRTDAARPAEPGTGLIQLGAYASEAAANQAYTALAQRYAFLGTMPKIIAQTKVGGTIYYRLRISAGQQANDICARLKAGGAGCIVVK